MMNDYFNLAPLVKMKMQIIAVGAKLQFWKMAAMLLQLLYSLHVTKLYYKIKENCKILQLKYGNNFAFVGMAIL